MGKNQNTDPGLKKEQSLNEKVYQMSSVFNKNENKN